MLRAVAAEDAYANLVLPARIRHHGLDKRDAGFATELSYGALRGQGTYDAILARCVDRPLDQLDPAILDALRIGAHQLLAMRVPAHAALDQTVGLARAVIGAGPSALINAVLRKVSAHTLDEWLELLLSDETGRNQGRLDPLRPPGVDRPRLPAVARGARPPGHAKSTTSSKPTTPRPWSTSWRCPASAAWTRPWKAAPPRANSSKDRRSPAAVTSAGSPRCGTAAPGSRTSARSWWPAPWPPSTLPR